MCDVKSEFCRIKNPPNQVESAKKFQELLLLLSCQFYHHFAPPPPSVREHPQTDLAKPVFFYKMSKRNPQHDFGAFVFLINSSRRYNLLNFSVLRIVIRFSSVICSNTQILFNESTQSSPGNGNFFFTVNGCARYWSTLELV